MNANELTTEVNVLHEIVLVPRLRLGTGCFPGSAGRTI
jgi:hypothetical protein